jgi:hypothetical protein
MFFVHWDPASTTPEMFLSFGDKQARKVKGWIGARPPECLTHHLVWKTHNAGIAKTAVFVEIFHTRVLPVSAPSSLS